MPNELTPISSQINTEKTDYAQPEIAQPNYDTGPTSCEKLAHACGAYFGCTGTRQEGIEARRNAVIYIALPTMAGGILCTAPVMFVLNCFSTNAALVAGGISTTACVTGASTAIPGMCESICTNTDTYNG